MPGPKPKQDCGENAEFGFSLTKLFLVRPHESLEGKTDEQELDPLGGRGHHM